MSRAPASLRLRRLLAIIPWIAGQDGPSVADVCRRFDLSRAQLLADLDVVFMVGLHPFTPDELIDVVIEDDRIWLRLTGAAFSQPLRLSPEQALQLVAASSSLLSTPGADPHGPLARGLGKLAALLGISEGEALSVTLGRAPAETLAALRDALAGHVAVRIDYYAYGRDERTNRVVEPHQLFAEAGQWYLKGWCRLAGAERLFRVDRIQGIDVLAEAVDIPADRGPGAVYHPRAEDPRVTILLRPSARWVLEQYDVERVEPAADGAVYATLAISATPWLERLLVRLGPDAELISTAGAFAEDVAAEAARRILGRYQLDPPG